METLGWGRSARTSAPYAMRLQRLFETCNGVTLACTIRGKGKAKTDIDGRLPSGYNE
jgi:hypothetical protein